MKKRKKVIIIAIALVAVVAVAAIAVTSMNGKKKKGEDVKMEVVRRGEFVVEVRETGNLESLISVEVRSNVEGEIEQIFVKEGDFVEKGQKLIQIDDQQIQEQKKQAEANRDARFAQLQQAELRIDMTEKEQKSKITQAQNAVKVAEASLESLEANTTQRIAEADTQISTTKNLREQDLISLRQAEIGLQQAQLILEQYQSGEESARISFETADSELKRQRDLFEKKLVSKKALEDAETRCAGSDSQYETAKKNVQSQRKAVESGTENIKAREQAIKSRQSTLELHQLNFTSIKESQAAQKRQLHAELENARIRLQQLLETTDQEKDLTRHSETGAKASLLEAQSRLDAQEERLTWTTIVAPMSGTITRLEIEEGEIVTSGRSAFSRSPALMIIDDLDRMIVKTRINEVEIAQIKIGQEAEIKVDSYPDKVFEGSVIEISPSANLRQEQGGDGIITFEVNVEVLGSPSELLPGMSADVDIIVFHRKDILQLPIESVMTPDILTVKATISSEDLKRLRSDAKVEVQNLIGKKFSARVGKIWTNKSRGNVEILLDGTPRGLRTGPTEINILIPDKTPIDGVEAEIISERKYFVQLDKEVPEDIQKKRKKDKKNKEKGIKTRIEVGKRNNSHFEILSGVIEGDRVFVPSMEQLTKQDRNK